jgi:hypothetical protein
VIAIYSHDTLLAPPIWDDTPIDGRIILGFRVNSATGIDANSMFVVPGQYQCLGFTRWAGAEVALQGFLFRYTAPESPTGDISCDFITIAPNGRRSVVRTYVRWEDPVYPMISSSRHRGLCFVDAVFERNPLIDFSRPKNASEWSKCPANTRLPNEIKDVIWFAQVSPHRFVFVQSCEVLDRQHIVPIEVSVAMYKVM